MKIGIPKEIKDNEYRVGIVPSGVEELVSDGHEVMIQEGAGLGNGITDEDFVSAGAVMLQDAGSVWGAADLVMKVKEPLKEEYDLLKDNQILFTFLHLAPLPDLVDVLLDRGIRSVAYGLGAEVAIIDRDHNRLSYIDDIFDGKVVTLMSNTRNIREAAWACDMLVGGVLLAGALAPRLISRVPMCSDTMLQETHFFHSQRLGLEREL